MASTRLARLALLAATLLAASAAGAPAAATADDGDPPRPPGSVATDVEAVLAGETITVSWRRPADALPGRQVSYWLRLNGALEWLERSSDDLVQVSFPVVDPGTTHVYTVQKAGRSTPISEPALLTVPAAEDTTAPTAPSWEIGFDAACMSLTWHVLTGSVDDTTPASQIRYEARNFDVIARDHHIIATDFQPAGTGLENFGVVLPEEVVLRAVDAAGNRSAPVKSAPIQWVC